MSEEGINIATPTQAGIYKAVMKEADRMKEELKKTIKKYLWTLHFDGKKIKQKEVLKNNDQEIKLATLLLEDGKAKTIVSAFINLIYEKVITCDTTNTKTGAKGGVVVYLKKDFYNILVASIMC